MPKMTPERWRQIERLLQEALERDAGERAGFLERACAGDPGMREEVALLLASQPDANFLAANALEDATMLLGEEDPDSVLGRNFAHYFARRASARAGNLSGQASDSFKIVSSVTIQSPRLLTPSGLDQRSSRKSHVNITQTNIAAKRGMATEGHPYKVRSGVYPVPQKGEPFGDLFRNRAEAQT